MFLASSLPHACEQGQTLIGRAGPLGLRWHSWPTSAGTAHLPSLPLACFMFFPEAGMSAAATFLVYAILATSGVQHFSGSAVI